jgi:two-component system, sensor histidine kinase and response regulator
MKHLNLTLLLTLVLTVSVLAQSDRADSLRSSINPAILEQNTLDSILELSNILMDAGSTEEAREWLLLGYEVAEKKENSSGKFSTLSKLSQLYILREQPDSAMVYILDAEEYALNPDQRLELLDLKGTAYRLNRQLILASEQFERAITLADSLGDARFVAGMNMNLGHVYSQLDDDINALRSFYEALEFAELNQDSLFIASANNYVGHKFYQIGNYEQAEYNLLRSESISRQIGSVTNLRKSILNLGNLYSKLGNYEKAGEYFDEALELARADNDRIVLIRIYYNIGIMEARKGNFGDAAGLFNLALEESQALNHKEGEFRSTTGLGNLEMEQGNIARALRWFFRANEIVEDDEFSTLRLVSYENLYNTYKELGDFNQSLQWLESYNDLNENISTTEKSRLLAEYEALFNLQQSKQQADILQARQQETESRLEYQRTINVIVFGWYCCCFLQPFSLFGPAGNATK